MQLPAAGIAAGIAAGNREKLVGLKSRRCFGSRTASAFVSLP